MSVREESLKWICRSVLQSSFPIFRGAEIDACFYPYIGLTHTIRRKGTRWMIRISDHCRYAPRPVFEAIVMILGCKIARKRLPDRFLQIYEAFRKDPWIEESVRERRRRKGRKRIAACEGKHHSRAEIYKEINARFFNNQVEVRKIGWGLRKGWRRLGHYDPIHHTITLSPALDSPKVPDYVVRYIVYHEMLHAVFEDTPSCGFRRHHPPEFHRAERAHPDFPRAKKFLREYFGNRR
jgi:predicted metal-dependent hydrolase